MKNLARVAVFAFVSFLSVSAFATTEGPGGANPRPTGTSSLSAVAEGPAGGNPHPTGTGSLSDVVTAVLIAFGY